jgi:two-component system chemotaxis response regulator CheB
MARIRVLVVDDSLTVRRYLADVLGGDPEIEVVAEAENGKRAIELCQQLSPQVVSMDMMMPVMTGLAATEFIMAYFPTPILVVSASHNRQELFQTYDALSAGAVDVLEKPPGGSYARQWEDDYRRAIKTVSRIRVITHPRARLEERRTDDLPREGLSPSGKRPRLVAIGASTGGPGALARLLQNLPADFPFPILAVIHINAPFGRAMTDWLGGLSPLRVRAPVNGEPLPEVGQPQVILAAPDRHLVLRGGRLWTTADAERHHCRPSVDVLFESLAQEAGDGVIACLLTGMGRDGASGLLAIRRGGGMTIAQNEASSVVFGMPREAIELGAARFVLGLEEIPPLLLRLVQSPKTRESKP